MEDEKVEQFDYDFIVNTLKFKVIESCDDVYFKTYGFKYKIFCLRLNKNSSLDWCQVDRTIKFHKELSQCDHPSFIIKSKEELFFIIKTVASNKLIKKYKGTEVFKEIFDYM